MNARMKLLQLTLLSLPLGLGACAEVDSPFRILPRESAGWSAIWIIVAVLVSGTLAAAVVKLQIELRKKRRAPQPSTAAAVLPERAPIPQGVLVTLFTGLFFFAGGILTMVAIFLTRDLSAVELIVTGAVAALGWLLLRLALRRISALEPDGGA